MIGPRLHPSAVTGSPWTADDLLRFLATSGIGAALSAVAWYQANDEVALADQVQWANLAVGGFVLASYGMLGWLLRGRRAVGQRRVGLLGEPARAAGAPVEIPAATSTASAGGALVAGRERRYYHAAGCPLAADRGWTKATRSAHEKAGRQPCGVCRP